MSTALSQTLPPRAPGALPILGHGVQLVRRRLEFLQEVRRFGPIVSIGLGPTSAFLVNDHTLLHQLLVTDAAIYERGVHFQKARAVAGNGIITASGPFHRKQRKMVLPAFNHRKVRNYAVVMRELAGERIARWSETDPIELRPEFLSLATSVATKSLFSTVLATSAVAAVERALPILTRTVSLRAMDPTGLVEKLPTPGKRLFDNVMGELDTLIGQIITEYRGRGDDEGNDLLSMMMLARDAETGEGMDDQQIRDEVISILLSSAETTALTMSWACHELGTNPHTQEKLQAEVDEVLGGAAPEYEDLAKLEYTRRVVRETLRMYPPTYFLSRTALEDSELGGYRIPKGSTVLYSFYSQHRDPELFTAPDRFDPDRWLPERADDITQAAYVPFGEGVHRCVGEGFAWAEAMTSLATIAASRTLHPVPGKPVRPVGTVTLAPNHLEMYARPRAGR